MKESLLAAIGMWLVFLLVFVSLVGAQTGPPPAPASKPATTKTPAPAQSPAQGEVSGKIKSIDPAGRTVLLEDGTRLMIPASVNVDLATLKAGAIVKASVENKGGQKVVTAIQVN